MSTTSHQRRLLERRVLPLLLVINLLLLLYYVLVDYRYAVHSDSAVMNLLAQEIRDTGQFFPRGWNYANGDLWVWFTQAIIVPLLAFLPNSYGLHAVSSLLTAALVLLGSWCLSRLAGQSRLATLVCLLLLTSGISVNMAENLYGQAAYGTLYYMGCLLAYTGWRYLHADAPAARRRWGAAVAVLTVLVFWSNPQRAMVFYGLPLLLATLALHGAQVSNAGSAPASVRLAGRRRLGLAGVVLLSILVGAALHGHYVKLVGNSGLAPAAWLGFDGMVRNFEGTLRGLLSLLGGLPPEGARVISLAGALIALRCLAAVALLALMPWALRRALRAPLHPGRLFIAVYALGSIAVNLFITLTTTLPDMAAPEASIRYLVPSMLYLLVLLTGIAIDDFRWSRVAHPGAVLALLCIGLSAPLAYRVEHAPHYFARGGVIAYSPYAQFAEYLEQHGLKYGYASFWNAGRLTLLSEQQARVRQISIDNGLPVPVRHLSSDRWYQAATWQGPTFLMQTEAEAQLVDWAQMARYAGAPTEILSYRGWRITVYPHNLAGVLPFWDYDLRTPLRYDIDASTEHRIGHLTEDGHALQSEAGESGHLHYGHYRAVAPGHYQVTFDLSTSGAGVSDFGVVDAAFQNGATVLAAKAIKQAGAQRITLELRLPEPVSQLEFRVWSNGAGQITLRHIELALLDPRT